MLPSAISFEAFAIRRIRQSLAALTAGGSMRTAALLLLAVLSAAACDSAQDRRRLPSGPSVVVPPGTSTSVPTPSISSITPGFAIAGSSDLVLKVTGTNFSQDLPGSPFAIWSANGVTPNHDAPGTNLATTFVSSTELTAVIPAALLSDPRTAGLTVMNGDIMGVTDGYFNYPRSNSVSFTVMQAVYLATLAASPSCASAIPSTARERTYTAKLLPNGTLEWTGPTLNPPSGHGTISSATISENAFSFFVDYDRDPQSDDFHGLWEDMGGGTILNISGKGSGRLHDGEITGMMDGLFAFYEPDPNVVWIGHYCHATDHRFRFVKQ
jgi:hypothetical protein